jgi:phospholipid transport system transporter-binding protein
VSPVALTVTGDTLQLSGELDFETVVDLERQGADWLAQAPQNCRIDLSGITHSTSAGLAMLLSWWRLASASGKQLLIAGMPPRMMALARVGKLTDTLPLADG